MSSIGEERVGLDFNPSGNQEVTATKVAMAHEIDNLQRIVDHGGEAGRAAAIAQTKIEGACMWTVKAITKNL